MATLPNWRTDLVAWHADIRRLDDAGFDTLAAADHFTGGWTVEPFVALTAAAAASPRLRLQTNVLSNDYRHPVLAHRMAATLDLFSVGRLELGIGGGWMQSDYEAAGFTFDQPRIRIDRLAEAITVIKGLFAPEPFTFDGEHFHVHDLTGVPSAVQQPHPPLFIGGGGKRVLSIAGRAADIVGIHANLGAGHISPEVVAEMTPARVHEKVQWVCSAAEKAGRDMADLELHMNFRFCAVEPTSQRAHERLAKFGAQWGVDVDMLAHSPQILVGSVQQCAEGLMARRDAFGLSYFHFDPGPVASDEIDGYQQVMEAARTEAD
jgi:probable F420-dependent oxidoreductase